MYVKYIKYHNTLLDVPRDADNVIAVLRVMLIQSILAFICLYSLQAVRVPDDGRQHPKHAELPTEI